MCYNKSMNNFTPLSIAILSMLIIASLYLIPGVFALFYHYASGKYSAKKVGDLSIFFILGAETLPALIFIMINSIIYALSFINLDLRNNIFLWTTVGLLFALGIAFFCFYFRRGNGTRLFITRKTASNFEKKASLVKTNSDAFVLGLTSGIPELIFTFPLYLIVFIEITRYYIFSISCSFIFILFIFLTITPLFFVYTYFKIGNNLANYLRKRASNKTFFRFFVPILYFILALLIIFFRIIV